MAPRPKRCRSSPRPRVTCAPKKIACSPCGRQMRTARNKAEENLRNNNLNLETTVDERPADLREANDEIQRFAYIVSHDLRSPLVNIMGFTSELEELRGDIFRRIATLARSASSAPLVPENASDNAEPALDGP